MKQASLSIEGLRSVVEALPPDNLTPAREAALAHLGEHGIPTLRDEDWKYTDLSPVVDISNRWLTAGGGRQSPDTLLARIDEITGSIDANWLVVANGVVLDPTFPADGGNGVQVAKFSDAPAPLVFERPLADFNAALLQDGLRVRISGTVGKPVGILLIDQSDGDASVSQAWAEIDVDANSAVELIEYHVSQGNADHYANSVLTLNVGANADVRHVRIQNRSTRHVQTGRTSVSLGRDSRLDMASYDLGGGLIRNDIDVDLSQPGADITFNGLYLAGEGQHIDNHTRVDHRVGPATSAQEYRGILNGNCRCVWNGKAIVHEGADGTDARQANHNLLLSEKAEIDAKPELEIYADDVKCAHGTTVGQLDERSLFYLRTRGLDKRHARQVLTHAFAADLVSRAPVDAARSTVSAIVDARLADLIEAEFAEELVS